MTFKPLLAAKKRKEQSQEEFLDMIAKHLSREPMGATPKIDGIRCTCQETHVPRDLCLPLTRSLKLIPNLHIREQLRTQVTPGIDGELTCGKTFQAVTSGVMTESGKPDFTYYVFDYFDHQLSYQTRLMRMENFYLERPAFVKILTPVIITSIDQLLKLDEEYVQQGAEGTMIRLMSSPYKQGRSTQREGYLIALKRFEDAEAMIIGSYEEMHNDNPQSLNELGYTERSSHKANMSGKGRLGGFYVRNLSDSVEFKVGSGFTASDREFYWAQRDAMIGKIIKYKHQPHGRKDKPRTPIFLGIRDPRDMDAITTPDQGELL